MSDHDSALGPEEIDRIALALGQAARVSYAPPNIYPMSAPTFTAEECIVRPHPQSSELGLYVHVPFCNYSCSFCFYATKLTPAAEQVERYLAALESELQWVEPGTRLTQLYVGGGTPTALSPEQLGRLLMSVFQRIAQRGNSVHTVETSPESITPEHVKVLQSHGIERVSMGIQSLSEGVLGTVRRRHDGPQALAACDLLVGFGLMVNVDLIYGLPGQTEDNFCNDFAEVAGRGVQSITAYNLRVNERTPVGRDIRDDERLDLATLVRWRATVRRKAFELDFEPTRWHTYCRREASGPARDIVRRFVDITGHGNQFGIGVSARSRLNGVVYRNVATYDTYLQRMENGESPVGETFKLSETDRKLRHVALTLGDGGALVRDTFRQEFGVEFDDEFGEAAKRLAANGLVVDEGSQIVMSPTGQLVYDLVMRAFYPAPVRNWLDDRQQLAQTAANLRGAKPKVAV